MFFYKFVADQDIDVNSSKASFDCHVVDRKIKKMLLRADRALGGGAVSAEECAFIEAMIPLFRQTHLSIRKLCRSGFQFDGLVGDAMSLAREQIEKLFAIQLVLESPDRWISVYNKDGWKKGYRMLLHQQHECRDLPRFKEFNQEIGPMYFENLRLVCGVTEEEKDIVELEFKGVKLSSDQKRRRIRDFPTPGEAWKILAETDRGPAMKRWYVEYQRYCSYSHALTPKVVLNVIQNNGIRMSDLDRYRFMSNHIDPTLIISYLAIGAACAEVYLKCKQDMDLLESISEFWEEQREGSLLAIALYDLRIKAILPTVIGASA